MIPSASNSQIAKIHVMAGRAGLEGDTYRAFLNKHTGKTSSKDLTRDEAGRLIETLNGLTGAAHSGAVGAVAGLDSKIGRKLRALWIAGHNLGLVRDRTDRAMLSFLERQTGVSHVRFLREPGEGTAAIEGLKSWLARDGGVRWPLHGATDEGALLSRQAVLEAQWSRLAEIGAVEVIGVDQLAGFRDYAMRAAGKMRWQDFGTSDYDAVQAALGRKLRKALQLERMS